MTCQRILDWHTYGRVPVDASPAQWNAMVKQAIAYREFVIEVTKNYE
tara:strand:- start:1573 stop:1713 length:141 start_codon:yes stop_codon:yes gene_type:complete